MNIMSKLNKFNKMSRNDLIGPHDNKTNFKELVDHTKVSFVNI